jgi:polyhydroxyalkanoate synthesis regulator phasin
MPDKTPAAVKPAAADVTPGASAAPPVRRHPGHRGADVRDTVAEMAAKAQEISMEAGSKMAAAMKDVINAAAGLTSFAIESSRDLVQYMVRRGQMTQDEADKLIREAEDAWSKKHKGRKPPARGPASTPIEKPPASAVGHVAAVPRVPTAHAKAARQPARKTARKAARHSARGPSRRTGVRRPAAKKVRAKKRPAPKK